MEIKKLFLFLMITLLFVISGCNTSSTGSTGSNLKGPDVTRDEALKIAKDYYNLSTIKKVDIRHLSDDELDKVVPENAKKLTPVYFVIQGKDKNQNEITVFVNSNDKKFNYSNH